MREAKEPVFVIERKRIAPWEWIEKRIYHGKEGCECCDYYKRELGKDKKLFPFCEEMEERLVNYKICKKYEPKIGTNFWGREKIKFTEKDEWGENESE